MGTKGKNTGTGPGVLRMLDDDEDEDDDPSLHDYRLYHAKL